jgi:ABC-type phosphate transport system substrate-binding protein
MNYLIKMIILTLLFSVCSGSLFADVKVIVNNSFPEDKIDVDSLKKAYSNRKNRWDHGGAIIVCVLKSGAVHQEFMKVYTGKSPQQFTMFWRQQLFTGAGTAPREFENEETLMQFIGDNENAIGYISDKTETNDKVKVLTVE